MASLSMGQKSSVTSIKSVWIFSKAWHLHSSNVGPSPAVTDSATSFMHVSASFSPDIQAGMAFMARTSHCSLSTDLESSARHPASLMAALITSNLSKMVSQPSAGFDSSQQVSQAPSSSGSSVSSHPGKFPGGTYLPKVAE